MKMKLLVSVIFFFSFFAVANAQINIGVSAAYGEAWQDIGIHRDSLGCEFNIKSFRFATSINYPITSYLEISLEPAYVRRGTGCDFNFARRRVFEVMNATYEGNYIELPLILQGKISFLKDKLICLPKIGAGPAYLVNAYRTINPIDHTASIRREKVNFDKEDYLNRMDFGLHLGLAIGMQIGTGMLQVEFRYYEGYKDTSNEWKSLNRSLHWGIGYNINL